VATIPGSDDDDGRGDVNGAIGASPDVLG